MLSLRHNENVLKLNIQVGIEVAVCEWRHLHALYRAFQYTYSGQHRSAMYSHR